MGRERKAPNAQPTANGQKPAFSNCGGTTRGACAIGCSPILFWDATSEQQAMA
jgi:hypothetical protein